MPKLGLRILKSALAVFLCFVVYLFRKEMCIRDRSTMTQRLSSFLWAANIAASHTWPSSISPSPSTA